mgnify:CR=1 FL=1
MKVGIWGSLRPLAGGEAEVEVEARTVRDLLDRLVDRHPGLKAQLDRGVAVSINGQIYRDAWFQPVPEGAEVFILPRLAGG